MLSIGKWRFPYEIIKQTLLAAVVSVAAVLVAGGRHGSTATGALDSEGAQHFLHPGKPQYQSHPVIQNRQVC